MAFDFVIRNARLASATAADPPVDIGIERGRIVALAPRLQATGPEHDARGKLVSRA